MADLSKIDAFALLGDADPVPQSLFLSHPEQAQTLALLYEVSREVTSILDREELLRRVAERIKKIVKCDVFSVMLWNEQAQRLESVFAMCCGDSIPARMRVALHKGLTGTAAGERRILRVNDVSEDPRYIHCETGVAARSELVVPLLFCDRLIGVLDLESSNPHASTPEHERLLSTLAASVPARGDARDSDLPLVQHQVRLTLHSNALCDLRCALAPPESRQRRRPLSASRTRRLRAVHPSRRRPSRPHSRYAIRRNNHRIDTR